MNWLYIPYLIALLGSVVISLTLAGLLWRRRTSPGAIPLIILMLAVAEWSLGSAFQLSSHELDRQLFWAKLQYPGIVTIPVAWVVFALQFTGRKEWLNRWTYLLLASIPVLTVILVWTNDIHHWMWTQASTIPGYPLGGLNLTYNLAFWVFALYAYGLIALGGYLILKSYLDATRELRKKVQPILIGILPPLAVNIIYVFKLSPFNHLDLTPLAFTITNIFLAIGLHRFWLFDLIPVARSTIIDGMHDGMFVFDVKNRVVDLNEAASHIIGRPAAEVIGQPASLVFSAWPNLLKRISPKEGNPSADILEEITLGVGSDQRNYELRSSPLEDQYGSLTGRLILWTDITSRKQAAEALMVSQQRYRQSVEKSPNPIFSINRDGIIQTWNKACETVFQYGQEIIGQSYHKILHTPDEQTEIKALIEEVFDQKASLSSIDTTYRTKDGSLRHMVSRLYPVVDQAGAVETCVFANTDITERKQADEAMRRRLEELTVLHATATACVEATTEDELIERISKIIGESLYTDNFGVLFKNEDSGELRFHPSYRGLPESLKGTEIAKGQGITGQVALSGTPRRVSDVTASQTYKHIHFQTRSELCVPIKIGEQVIGVVNAESAQPDTFSEADERVLNTIAGQLATAIKRLRAEAAERHRADELLAVTRVSREITSMLDRQAVLDSIAHRAAELSGSDASGIFIYRPNARFYLVATYGVGEEFVNAVNVQGVPSEGTAVGRAVARLRPVQVPDVLEDRDYKVGSLAEMENIRAILALPLLSGEKVIGGIVLWHRHPYRFLSNEIIYLEALAQQSVNAIENARFFEAEREQRDRAEALREIGNALSSTLDFNSVLDRLLDQIARLVPYDSACVMIIEDDHARVSRARGYRQFGEAFAKQISTTIFEISSTPNLLEMFTTHQPLVVPDTKQYLGWLEIGVSEHMRSFAGVPVIEQDKVVAFFTLDKKEPGFYQPEHAGRLAAFAGQAGLALQNARLFEEARRRASHLEALNAVIAAAASAVDMQSLLEVSLDFTLQALEADAGSIHVGDQFTSRQIPAKVFPRIIQAAEESGVELPKPFCVADWSSKTTPDPLTSLAAIPLEFKVRASIAVPILSDGFKIGAIGLAAWEPRAWSNEEVALLEAIGRQLGAATERLGLLEETQRRLREVTLLSKIISLTASAADLNTALNQACAEVAQFFRAQQVGFALLNADGTAAEVISEFRAPGRPSAYGLQIPVADNPSMTYILEHKTPLAIADAQTNPLLKPVHKIMRQRGVVSILLAPILLEGRVAGTLGVDKLEQQEFTQADVDLMKNIAQQISQALERLNLLAKTQEQAQQVQQIMDAVPEGVLLLNAERRVVLANPAAHSYLSILAGSSDLDGPLSSLAEQPIETLLKSHNAGPWFELETDGANHRSYEIAARPLDARDQDDGWVLVIRDVTRERENQSRIQMQERLATVGQLAAGIAHDFNNIMAAIMVYADLLNMEPHLSPASRERLTTIQQQVQRATSLIRQILDFSRRSVMEQSSLDLLPFIKELDKLLARVLPENIRLELSYQPDVYLVQADPTRLQQVFMNLALNARDAMPSGGVLHFELGWLQVTDSNIHQFPDLSSGDWVRIEVRDTGTGISPEAMPHIFDPFFTTKPVGQGTGLGLAQVYGIIKQHSGSIDVSSQPGRGASFVIYLPALTQPPVEPEPHDVLEEMNGSGETILVVEDDAAAREAMRALLETQNYKVLTAKNGVEALRIFNLADSTIAAVVSDIVMPEMGGITLYRTLRRKKSDVKILFVTGHPLESENQAILEEGRVHWLQKPFSVNEFTHVLQDLLDGGD